MRGVRSTGIFEGVSAMQKNPDARESRRGSSTIGHPGALQRSATLERWGEPSCLNTADGFCDKLARLELELKCRLVRHQNLVDDHDDAVALHHIGNRHARAITFFVHNR
jgi:hypothetical protein